jgi:dihydrofolate reductase
LGADADMGFGEFIGSVDSIIMGRNTMEMISAMNLTDDQWPYGTLPLFVLRNSLTKLPDNMMNKATLVSTDIQTLMLECKSKGLKHAYIDGGKTIQSFLNLKLINQITLTRVPILLGQGIPLFAESSRDINLEKARAKVFKNDYVQEIYDTRYD